MSCYLYKMIENKLSLITSWSVPTDLKNYILYQYILDINL